MNYQALLLTSLAGLSTIIGYFFIYKKGNRAKIISSALGFSIGIMVTISVIELLPESFEYFTLKFDLFHSLFFTILFFFIGSGITLSISYISPQNSNSLYRVGIMSLITLMLHNIPEGIITYLTSTIELNTGIMLSLSIACHNIPEGICIAVPIYYSTKSKIKAFSLVFVSAISEPIGAIIAWLFLQNDMSNIMIAFLLSLVAGIMITVAFKEIFKEASRYSLIRTFIMIIVGSSVSIASHLLF